MFWFGDIVLHIMTPFERRSSKKDGGIGLGLVSSVLGYVGLHH